MPARVKVLLAETDRAAARSTMQALKDCGLEVMIAADAVHALTLSRQEKPDVLLLSNLLAGGAVAGLKRIRSNVYTTHIPVVAVVARGGPAPGELLSAGAQECVVHPCSAPDLHAAVQRNLLQSLDFTQAPADVLAAPERIADVQQSALLDSPPDDSFDLLTRLSARLLAAPMALTTIVDKDRQFFKSQVGLGQPWAGARQTRLSHSFCQWVVSGREDLVIRDATVHPVLKKNLAIKDMGVVAYAGVPLYGRSGQAIGSFCAIESRARDWSEEDLATLKDLASIAEACVHVGSRGPALPDGAKVSSQVGAKAILGASRLLRRYHARIGDVERGELLGLIERQAEHLLRIA